MMRSGRVIRQPLVTAMFVLAFGTAYAASAFGQSFDWTGGHVGGHLGRGAGTTDTAFNPLPDAISFDSLKPTTLSMDPTGFLFGGQAGYNFQVGHFVVGAEGVFSISRMDGSTKVLGLTKNDGTPWEAEFPGVGSFLSAGEKTTWLLHIRARAGVQAGHALIYGAFGPTIASITDSADSYFGPPTFFSEYATDTPKSRHGWHWAAGAEVAASKKVSVFGEFLSYTLADQSLIADPFPDPNDPTYLYKLGYTWHTKATILRGGVNLRF